MFRSQWATLNERSLKSNSSVMDEWINADRGIYPLIYPLSYCLIIRKVLQSHIMEVPLQGLFI